MMPAHRMRGTEPPRRARETSAADIGAVFDKAANDVMRDGDRRRRGQALRMPPRQHRGKLLAVEPARVFEFLAVDDEIAVKRLGVAADHHRRGEWPGLRREIAHPAAADADLFEHFAPDRLLDRLAWLDEAGKTRPHGRREP